MLILDTDVLSEVLRRSPNAGVLAWVDVQPRHQLFTTAITRAEIFYGIALLPKGSRRQKLKEAAVGIFDEDLEDKVLAFDGHAAARYAEIAARSKAAGTAISQSNAMIAAITQCHQGRLATRNIQDFRECDIELINPWQCA